MKLYHYVHCPYCIRVRMALGYLDILYESKVLTYDDEQTPMVLCNKKMLPILEFSQGDEMNESLDIIARLDKDNALQMQLLKDPGMKAFMDNFMEQLAEPINKLCMPYWVWSPEFDEKSRNYYMEQKIKETGPFYQLIQNKGEFLAVLPALLNEIEHQMEPFYKSQVFTIFDIMIASHLWGLYIFPEFQFSPILHRYLQVVKKLCKFNYHEDFWRGPRKAKT